jgi:hypothetical protein
VSPALEFDVSVSLLYVDSVGSLYTVSDKITYFKQKILEYVGNLERMIHRRVFKTVLESKPEGRRRMGRPRLKWLDNIKENLREMKVATEGSG